MPYRTHLRVLQHGRSLAAVRELRPWLVRITWRLAIDRRRRSRPEQLDEIFAASLVSPDLSPEAALTEARRLTAILREIDHLPRVEREALLLCAEDDLLPSTAAPAVAGAVPPSSYGASPAALSSTELAAILRRSPAATRALIFRARTRLRDRLAKKGLQ